MITVQNFRFHEKRHQLRIESGIDLDYTAESFEAGGAKRPVGFGDVVTPFFGTGTGVAICVLDRELNLFLGGLCVDLFEPGLHVTRRTLFPLIKRFELERESKLLFTCTYLAMDAFEDPMNGTRDILKFVAELAASAQQRLRFYYTWQVIQRGDDITDKKIQAWIDTAVANHTDSSH